MEFSQFMYGLLTQPVLSHIDTTYIRVTHATYDGGTHFHEIFMKLCAPWIGHRCPSFHTSCTFTKSMLADVGTALFIP